jgi:hypothetical protein
MLQCNVTGSFIGARSFGVTFDGVTFLMFDKLFHFTKHAQTLSPQRGLAPELRFNGVDIPHKGLTDGGDPKVFCDVYDHLGLYSYSVPAKFGTPA